MSDGSDEDVDSDSEADYTDALAGLADESLREDALEQDRRKWILTPFQIWWKNTFTRLGDDHAEYELKSRQWIQDLTSADPRVVARASDEPIPRYILSIETRLAFLEDALLSARHLMQQSDGDYKDKSKRAVVLLLPPRAKTTNDLADLAAAAWCAPVAAFRDLHRLRPEECSALLNAVFNCAWNSLTPICFGTAVRENVPLAPLETDLALKYWVSPMLAHLVSKIREARIFAKPRCGSELLDYFQACVQYNKQFPEDQPARPEDVKAATHMAKRAAVNTWLTKLVRAGGAIYNRPADALRRLKTVQTQVESGHVPSYIGSKYLRALNDAELRGAEFKAQPKANGAEAVYFARDEMLAELQDPEALLRRMQRDALRDSPHSIIKGLDGKEYNAQQFESAFASPTAHAKEPPTLPKSNPVPVLVPDKVAVKPPASELKAGAGSWASKVREWTPAAAAAAGKGVTGNKMAAAVTASTSSSSSSSSSSDTRRWEMIEHAPVREFEKHTCPQQIEANTVYALASTFFLPDARAYSDDAKLLSASARYEMLRARFEAIQLDAKLNDPAQIPTQETPYRAPRLSIARIDKGIRLLSALYEHMSFRFEDQEITDLTKVSPAVVSAAIVTSNGRMFRRTRGMNMSKWLYGFWPPQETSTSPVQWSNCWIELKPETRWEVVHYVQTLLSRLRRVRTLSLAGPLTKAAIDSDPTLRGVNEFLAVLPARMDDTDPLTHAVFGADEPLLHPFQDKAAGIGRCATALLEMVHTRTAFSLFQVYTPERVIEVTHNTNIDMKEASVKWLHEHEDQASKRRPMARTDVMRRLAPPFLWPREPGQASRGGPLAMDLEKASTPLVPFKVAVDHLRRSMTLFSALVPCLSFSISRMVQLLYQFAVDEMLQDCATAQDARVPWTSSYRFQGRPPVHLGKYHPAGGSTVSGLVSEFTEEIGPVTDRIHKAVHDLVRSAYEDKDGKVNLSAVAKVIHKEAHNAERIPGLISHMYTLFETLLVDLVRCHHDDLYHQGRHAGDSDASSTSVDTFAAAHLVDSMNDLILKVVHAITDLVTKLGKKLTIEKKVASLEAKSFPIQQARAMHELVWKRIGAGERHHSNVFSLMNQYVNLDRCRSVGGLLYGATSAWMINELVFDAKTSFGGLSVALRERVRECVRAILCQL